MSEINMGLIERFVHALRAFICDVATGDPEVRNTYASKTETAESLNHLLERLTKVEDENAKLKTRVDVLSRQVSDLDGPDGDKPTTLDGDDMDDLSNEIRDIKGDLDDLDLGALASITEPIDKTVRYEIGRCMIGATIVVKEVEL